jgi:hypothetical protein
MSIDSSRRFKFLKVNNNSNQAKPLPSGERLTLARVKPSDFKRLIPVNRCCYFRRKRRLAQQNSCIRTY